MKQATFTPFPADWARSSHFQYYTKGFVKSVNSMTVRIDVTHFLAEVKRRNLKFFPAFAALTGQVIASIPEMCTAVEDGEIRVEVGIIAGGAVLVHSGTHFGKYTEADGAFTLPLTLTISHACMDGYHLSLFFNTLQYRLDCF